MNEEIIHLIISELYKICCMKKWMIALWQIWKISPVLFHGFIRTSVDKNAFLNDINLYSIYNKTITGMSSRWLEYCPHIYAVVLKAIRIFKTDFLKI